MDSVSRISNQSEHLHDVEGCGDGNKCTQGSDKLPTGSDKVKVSLVALTLFFLIHVSFFELFPSGTSNLAEPCVSSSTTRSPGSTFETTLRDRIDFAIHDVKLFAYQPPEHILSALALGRGVTRVYFEIEHLLWNGLPSTVYTDNPHEADFFVIKHQLVGNWIDRGPHENTVKMYVDNALVPLFEWIHSQPFWHKSGGRDHLFVYAMDGIFDSIPLEQAEHGFTKAFFLNDNIALRELTTTMFLNMTKIGYYGGSNSVQSKGKYWQVGKDIAMPMTSNIHTRKPPNFEQQLTRRCLNKRVPMFFRGSLVAGHFCSHGVRPFIDTIWKPACPTCLINHKGSVADAWFSLAPAGWACWSSRLFDAMERLSIPVIMATGADEPFAQFLDYNTFSYRLDGDSSTLLRNLTTLVARAEQLNNVCSGGEDWGRCLALDDAKKIRRLSEIRKLFLWDPSTNFSAWGMFMLTLFCRKPHHEQICNNITQHSSYRI